MSELTDLGLVAAVVAVAAIYLFRRFFGRKASGGCGCGCSGCSSPASDGDCSGGVCSGGCGGADQGAPLRKRPEAGGER